MVDRTHLVETALQLRAASPAGWENFLLALRNYQAQLIGEMVKCDVNMLVKAQGMVHSMTELTETLMNAPRIKEKQQEVRNGQRSKQIHPETPQTGF